MLIKEKPELTHADVTPKGVYLNRRKFLQGLGIAGAAAGAGGRAFSAFSPQVAYAGAELTTVKSGYRVNEKITPMNDVTHYNNFYEFVCDKGDPPNNPPQPVTTPC